MPDALELLRAIQEAVGLVRAEYERAATAGDIGRRDLNGRRLDALRQLANDPDLLHIIASQLRG
jgi:hypothetical protein